MVMLFMMLRDIMSVIRAAVWVYIRCAVGTMRMNGAELQVLSKSLVLLGSSGRVDGAVSLNSGRRRQDRLGLGAGLSR